MLIRCIVTLSAVLALGTSDGLASIHKAHRHHHRVYMAPIEAQTVAPAPFGGGRLVMHPASNIACNTKYRSTRAIPCDQPVWVYGSPCEVDLGLGRSAPCD
jgi:hypothetical protein